VLIAVIAVLVVAAGGWSAFWWVAAGRLKSEAEKWAQAAPAHGVEVKWNRLRVAGYPFAFRLELGEVAARGTSPGTVGELHAPLIVVGGVPWELHAADIAAPEGITATFGPNDSPTARLSAAKGVGAVAIDANAQRAAWLSLFDAKAAAGTQ